MKIKDEILFYCPCCKSDNIVRRYVYVSIDGTIPESPKDFCKSCGYYSTEKFESINFINSRNDKLTKILDRNGIQ